ncbi:recombinase family protein [Mycolicibacterium nivoides]|uniref:Recombinase family protein n=1 Tax=Mycolicibacterium nivoides TaxID=2487344 RepID=A0ABW9L948_9MYCO
MTAPGIRDGKRAVVYLRVSTDDQPTSIGAQRATCARIAAQHGYEIVGEYLDENVSGAIAIDKRPALKRALADLASDKADRLIVSKLDRLARNVRVALEIDEDYAGRHGWGIVLGDMDIDTSTAVGKMQLSMFATVARFERDRISERTREALAVKRSQGIRLGRPSTLPTEVVERIVTEREQGQSLRKIADGLTRDGIATAQGGRSWHASTVSKVMAGQDGKSARAATVSSANEGGNVYGVWQSCRHFSEPGLQPWAVSSDLSALETWAVANIPPLGNLRLFFAEKTGAQSQLTDANWTVIGHLYKSGIKMLRKDPERYNRNRSGPSPAPTWIHGNYPDPTELDWQRKTVNVDSVGN